MTEPKDVLYATTGGECEEKTKLLIPRKMMKNQKTTPFYQKGFSLTAKNLRLYRWDNIYLAHT
jgi:hypothetical protein